MGNNIKKEISDTLKSMEQGEFQTLCLEFLHLIDPIYEGLERHGGTANGKTRKGTPDLIKTFGDGRQIACQCSVAKDYWKPPKDERLTHKWKPCSDIDKCLNHLSNVVEIVICSSQEVPTDAADAKSKICAYTKDKTSAKVTLLDCGNIESILSINFQNPLFQALFKVHFPQLYPQIENILDAQVNRLAIQLTRERPVALNNLLRIAHEALERFPDLKEAKSYALKKIDQLESRFERKQFPHPGNIVRLRTEEFPFYNPIGDVIALVGVPKIGKTSIVAQYAKNWSTKNVNVRWFESPMESAEGKLLVEDISRAIWSCFLPPNIASDLAAGIIKTHSINFNNLIYKHDRPTVYILDNAELLLSEVLKSFCGLLSQIKSASLFSRIGFIFVSNKNIKNICPVISEQVSAPAWTQAELKKLLSSKISQSDFIEDKSYMDLLEAMSSGHPLVALALARKYTSREQLLYSRLQAPSLADEDLAARVKTLLFEDMLKDNDSLNLVVRMSLLVFKANERVLIAITKKIEPTIGRPVRLILENLYGTVIEGDEHQGYAVSFVYKEIAKEQLSQTEKQEIYDVVSSVLLKPKGKVINANEAIEGIHYAIFANVPERAFYWTSVLLNSAFGKDLPKNALRYVVDRLDFVLFLNPPSDPRLLTLYQTMLLSMAIGNFQIEREEAGLKILELIRGPSALIKDEGLRTHFEIFHEMVKIFKMVCLVRINPKESIRLLSEIDFLKIKKAPYSLDFPYVQFLETLVSALSIRKIPKEIIQKLIASVEQDDGGTVASLISVALSMAVSADSEDLSRGEIGNLLRSGDHITNLIHLMFNAQYAMQKEDPKRALQFVNQAETLCRNNNFLSDPVENIIRQLEGDIYYSLNDTSEARKSYLRCLDCVADDQLSFEFAWPSYRLGLLSDDPIEAEKHFRKSSASFLHLGYDDIYARSEGERAIALFQTGKTEEFVKTAEMICQGYYQEGKSRYAPACTVAIAQLVRLQFKLENEQIAKEKELAFPKFERHTFARALNEAKPRAEGLTAYYSLAKAYHLVGNIEKKMKCLRTAIGFEPINQVDKNLKPRVYFELLSEIILKQGKDEIKELIMHIFRTNLSEVTLRRETLSYFAFSPLDNILEKLDATQRSEFTNLLDQLEASLKDSDNESAGWFLADIYLRKARLAENLSDGQRQHELWRLAYQYGISYENTEVIVQASHSLCFKYHMFGYSIRDIADIQMNQIKAISTQGQNLQRLEIVGKNLFSFWQSVDFERLSERDLQAKQFLMDGAKNLEKDGFTSDDAAPIMILLCSQLYQYMGAATKWAQEKVKHYKHKISENILEKISHLI